MNSSNDDGSCNNGSRSSNNNNSNTNNNGWLLGFSLSPQLNNSSSSSNNMGQVCSEPHQTPTSACSPTSLPTTNSFLSAHHFHQLINNHNQNNHIYYYNGVDAQDIRQNGSSNSSGLLYSHPFPLMPLKSDGSLCIPQGTLLITLSLISR